MAVVSPSLEIANQPRSVTVLGSTGSIGCNTVDLLARNPGDYTAVALTGNRNVTLLAQQAKDLGAALAVTADESLYGELKSLLSGSGIEVAAGEQAVEYESTDESADRDKYQGMCEVAMI